MSAVAGWSDGQLRALASIFGTFVEPAYVGESERHAALAATALNEVAEPADLRQLRRSSRPTPVSTRWSP